MNSRKIKIPYIHNDIAHNTRAAKVILPLIAIIKKAQSFLDVGCGTGTWLKAGEEIGIDDYMGIDGTYVNADTLLIPSKKFIPKDITIPFDLGRRFDWVMCLEVAEHLPESAADTLVASLVRHGDFIVFSAAIPHQGGQNHINEQWFSYWQEKFLTHGYEFFDCIRPQIWNNPQVEVWYKQNIFVVTNQKALIKHDSGLINIVHPETYESRISDLQHILQGHAGIRLSFQIFLRSLKHFFKMSK